ncbi:hypothetical protein MAPG_05300, partial [Magnaporthiopsis poae ATCC 64411]|uniref:Uncharacterized protein n=1 Tax=Magnaporthiopsis poae (strain ATCC 64411 / 73-15) TaxID=644358 RepID=A0A0C4DZ13_MAGP6
AAGAVVHVARVRALVAQRDARAGHGHQGAEAELAAVACVRALKVYDEVRRERTRWLVGATREAVDLFEWDRTGMTEDEYWERFSRVIPAHFHRIWDYDLEAMVADGLGKLGLSQDPQAN